MEGVKRGRWEDAEETLPEETLPEGKGAAAKKSAPSEPPTRWQRWAEKRAQEKAERARRAEAARAEREIDDELEALKRRMKG